MHRSLLTHKRTATTKDAVRRFSYSDCYVFVMFALIFLFDGNTLRCMLSIGFMNHAIGDQQFKPNQHVTRAELTKMVALELHLPEKQLTFDDAIEGDWFYSYVSALANSGACGKCRTTNCPDPSYKHSRIEYCYTSGHFLQTAS